MSEIFLQIGNEIYEFHKVFTAEHDEFYKELVNWRDSLTDPLLKISCVYVLVSNTPICRLLDYDESGILYIGEGLLARNRERVGELINSINDRADQHDAGIIYNKHNLIKKEFPISILKVYLYSTGKARQKEKELLNSYFEKFGELPPLNRTE